MVSGMQRIPQTPVSVAVGQGQHVGLRRPAADQGHGHQGQSRRRVGCWSRIPALQHLSSEPTLSISANLAGSGGEIYSTFLKGDRFQSRPPKPTFSIVQAGGKTVATGNLEFG